VAGFSLGGLWALELLRLAPERIEGLALIASNAEAGSAHARRRSKALWRLGQHRGIKPLVRQLKPAYFHHPRLRRRHAALVADMARRTPPTTLRAQLEWAAVRREALAVLQHSSQRLMVVSGAQDGLCPPRMQRRIVAARPDAEWFELPQCGHFIPLERPATLSAPMARWIRSGATTLRSCRVSTAAELSQRYIPFSALKSTTEAFIDYCLPECKPKFNYALIGPGVSQNPNQPVNLREPHGFQVGGVSLPHGKLNPAHMHFTCEVFICTRGDWRIQWGFNPDATHADITEGDIVSVPTWLYRGFTNIGVDDGFLFTALGGDNTGGVLWGPTTLEAAAARGVFLTEAYRMVDETRGDALRPGEALLKPMTPKRSRRCAPGPWTRWATGWSGTRHCAGPAMGCSTATCQAAAPSWPPRWAWAWCRTETSRRQWPMHTACRWSGCASRPAEVCRGTCWPRSRYSLPSTARWN